MSDDDKIERAPFTVRAFDVDLREDLKRTATRLGMTINRALEDAARRWVEINAGQLLFDPHEPTPDELESVSSQTGSVVYTSSRSLRELGQVALTLREMSGEKVGDAAAKRLRAAFNKHMTQIDSQFPKKRKKVEPKTVTINHETGGV